MIVRLGLLLTLVVGLFLFTVGALDTRPEAETTRAAGFMLIWLVGIAWVFVWAAEGENK